MNFNTTQILWDVFRKAEAELKPNGGAILTVVDGHVSNGHEILARFDDNEAAVNTLRRAGYREIKPFQFKAR